MPSGQPKSALVKKWEPVDLKTFTARSQAAFVFWWGTSIK